MTTVPRWTELPPRPPARRPAADRRGPWIPTGAMIATRFMELRKRRGLMIALIVVNIGIPPSSWSSGCWLTPSPRSPTGRPAATTSTPTWWPG